MNREPASLIEKERVRRHFLLFRRSYEERMNEMASQINDLQKQVEAMSRALRALEEQ